MVCWPSRLWRPGVPRPKTTHIFRKRIVFGGKANTTTNFLNMCGFVALVPQASPKNIWPKPFRDTLERSALRPKPLESMPRAVRCWFRGPAHWSGLTKSAANSGDLGAPRVSPLWRRRALELGVPLAQAHSRPPCERNARGVGQTSRFERRVGALRISGLNENKNQTGKDIQTWHASTKTEMHDCVKRRCGSGIWYWWTLGAKAT